MSKRTKILLITLLVLSVVFGGFQYQKNQKYETYLNSHLGESLNSLSWNVYILHEKTNQSLNADKIPKASLKQIEEVLLIIQEESNTIERLAKILYPKRANDLAGVTYNTTKFMADRINLLFEEIDSNGILYLEEHTYNILKLIRDTGKSWDIELGVFNSSTKDVNMTDWVDTILRLQQHSERYQKEMNK
ncbi:hypothetical protein BKP35_17285 [Anaerobacillus arseniciselenatis]|uniref:Uncharacterized protein n=1 Tax=Anaerobacillus arseniciselenatis TaxID=85682 RepID=A0A1S2L9H0_9BACI|nr:hypothetical protein [Anaerobacillus arseniciselenatis]OIJ09152.1 hypothetical protein BKP35_17285 [Anaerobacillus arseniciselenatis]